MSYMLQHLVNGWQVDQAILSEEDRLVVTSQNLTPSQTNIKTSYGLYDLWMLLISGYSFRSWLGSNLHENGWGALPNSRESKKFCCYLLGGYHPCSGLQQNVTYFVQSSQQKTMLTALSLCVIQVRALWSMHEHVFLPQQTYHDRFRHW